MVAKDGGIFSFGDVHFYGSLPGLGLSVTDVIGTAATPTNKGYWIAEADGAVHAFGDAQNFGGYAPSLCDLSDRDLLEPQSAGLPTRPAIGSNRRVRKRSRRQRADRNTAPMSRDHLRHLRRPHRTRSRSVTACTRLVSTSDLRHTAPAATSTGVIGNG